MKTFFTLLCGVFAGLLTFSSFALDSDQSKPATLDADEFDLDLQTGVRTYRGNVVYQQGSIRLLADELVVYFKDDELERLIARGNPATFKQRPEDSENDVVGTALRIEMNDAKQLVTLKNKAKVTQEANTMTGKRITYNMTTEKVTVRSGKRKTEQPKQTDEQGEALAAALNDAKKDVEDKLSGAVKIEETENARPRLIIQPRK